MKPCYAHIIEPTCNTETNAIDLHWGLICNELPEGGLWKRNQTACIPGTNCPAKASWHASLANNDILQMWGSL